MKMNSTKVIQVEHECKHMSEINSQEKTEHVAMPCCDDSSHQCDNCSNCSQAATVMSTLPSSNIIAKLAYFNIEKFVINHLVLNGIPQNNLLRPPRTLV